MSDNLFHDHLDICTRCRTQPFNLCPTGEAALIKQTTGVDAAPRREMPMSLPAEYQQGLDIVANVGGPLGEWGKALKTVFEQQ